MKNNNGDRIDFTATSYDLKNQEISAEVKGNIEPCYVRVYKMLGKSCV